MRWMGAEGVLLALDWRRSSSMVVECRPEDGKLRLWRREADRGKHS